MIVLILFYGCDIDNRQVSDSPDFIILNSETTLFTEKSLDKDVVRTEILLANKFISDLLGSDNNNGNCTLSSVQQELLDAHNLARSVGRNCGAIFHPATSPLSWDCTLTEIADDHNQDMANNNFFSHTGSDGLQVADRATNAGYNWQTVGENIAAGYPNVDAVMQDWLKSSGHCENIMRPQFNELGADLYNAFGSQYSTYWTVDFGRKHTF